MKTRVSSEIPLNIIIQNVSVYPTNTGSVGRILKLFFFKLVV